MNDITLSMIAVTVFETLGWLSVALVVVYAVLVLMALNGLWRAHRQGISALRVFFCRSSSGSGGCCHSDSCCADLDNGSIGRHQRHGRCHHCILLRIDSWIHPGIALGVLGAPPAR